jgi:hypothetical protein
MAINPVVAGYDAVYAGLTRSPTLQQIWREHVLGPEYPIGFEHLSFLTFTELQRMASELRPARGGVLVDLGVAAAVPHSGSSVDRLDGSSASMRLSSALGALMTEREIAAWQRFRGLSRRALSSWRSGASRPRR